MDVASSGHIFAMRSAAADLTPAASLSEILGGLTQVYTHCFLAAIYL